MTTLPPAFRPKHIGPRRAAKVWSRTDTDRWRGSAAGRGYGHRWAKAAAAYKRQHPLCVCCKANGRIRMVALVDHVVPHKGDQVLFWDEANWQSLCNDCHNGPKKKLEARYERGNLSAEMLRLNRSLPEFFPSP